ncbi:MAG: hypothetical protein HOD60_03400, partial [Candidatus Nitrosopelagicus sp.]|nr:hypothetical protein [Candidatus Nitrosopelagicus sp.]
MGWGKAIATCLLVLVTLGAIKALPTVMEEIQDKPNRITITNEKSTITSSPEKTIKHELEPTSPLNVRAEARMLEYVNEIRAQNGVGNIKQVNELSQIAHASSSLSVEKGEIHNHEIGRKYDCSNVGGARTTGVAEVLTQEEVPLLYQINPENVGERFIDSWMGSDTGHREALLNP